MAASVGAQDVGSPLRALVSCALGQHQLVPAETRARKVARPWSARSPVCYSLALLRWR